MTLSINAIHFDTYDGEIRLPQRTTHRYTSPAVPYGGIQVLPPASPPFTLRCTRFAPASQLQFDIERFTASVGQIVALIDNGIVYEFLPYRLLFAIIDVQIVQSRRIVHAAGSRLGIPYSYTPAAQSITNFTFQAVPL